MKHVLALTFLVAALHANSQSIVVKNFSVADGLPSSEVYDVFQDSNGFIWFGTDNGVVRFDGYEMTSFATPEGLEDPVVFSISEDPKGKIWFRTYSGRIFYYDDGKIHRYAFNDVLVKTCRQTIMTSLYVNDNNVWFTADSIVGHINAVGQFSYEKVTKGAIIYKTLENGYVLGAHPGPAAKDEAMKFIEIDGKAFPVSFDFTKYQVYVYRSARWHNNLYITCNNYVFEYDGNQLKTVFTAAAPIISIAVDPFDNLWIGYLTQGATRFQNNDFKNGWIADFVSNKSVSQILFDNEGGLWATTLESGVYYVPDINLRFYSRRDSSKVVVVSALDNDVISGTQDGTVTVTNSANDKIIYYKNFPDFKMMAIFRDSHKSTWVSGGVLKLLDSTYRSIPVIGSAIHAFDEDKSGAVWAVSSHYLIKFDPRGENLKHKPLQGRFTNILLDDSRVYLAERLGIHVYDTNMNFVSAPETLSNLKVSKMLSLQDSLLLIATIGNGFIIVNKHTWEDQRFNANNRFMANNVYAAIKTDTSVWLGTEKGLFVASISSLCSYNPDFLHLTTGKGLLADKINLLAPTKTSMWVYSDDGVSVITNEALKRSVGHSPKFYLKDISINDRDVSVVFGILSFKNQNIAVRYRLKPTDKWIDTRERNLQLSSLAPGDYELEISHSTDNFHWKIEEPIRFNVAPPWWQQWYVQLFAFVVTSFLLFIYFRNRSLRFQRNHEKLVEVELATVERERARIAKELHDGVAADLSAIKLIVYGSLRSHQVTQANEIDLLLQTSIKDLKSIIYELTPPGLELNGLFVTTKKYIDRISASLRLSISIATIGDEVYTLRIVLPAFRIIQELLSNSLKHAGAENIDIILSSNNDILNIQFRDNGVGFTSNPDIKGLGIGNIKTRVDSLKGKMRLDSNENGTTYIINIPLN